MKIQIRNAFVAMTAVIALAGCGGTDSRIKSNPKLYASLSPAEQELIRQGKIDIGFTPDMVKMVLGEPDHVGTFTTKSKSRYKIAKPEIWSYIYDPTISFSTRLQDTLDKSWASLAPSPRSTISARSRRDFPESNLSSTTSNHPRSRVVVNDGYIHIVFSRGRVTSAF